MYKALIVIISALMLSACVGPWGPMPGGMHPPHMNQEHGGHGGDFHRHR